jgi:tetratricopeptide (TPR) repeat protein
MRDFGHIRGDMAFLESAPRNQANLEEQAAEWFAPAEQLTAADTVGAEQAYRKVLELAPSPHYQAYTNFGVLLCEAETGCDEALSVFDGALQHFPDDALLHFNRAVVLEELKRDDAAQTSYERCVELDPTHADAHFSLARLSESRGDKQGLVRHLSAYPARRMKQASHTIHVFQRAQRSSINRNLRTLERCGMSRLQKLQSSLPCPANSTKVSTTWRTLDRR